MNELIRCQYPALNRLIGGRPLVYLDSAATYLKPQAVIDAVSDSYRTNSGTVGRGVHLLAEEAAARFDAARETIANFINADADEIIFVRSATEAINLVAASLPEGSDILGSLGEHHSNLLPWRQRHKMRYLPAAEDGQIDLAQVEDCLTPIPALLAVSSIGNAFGNVQPIQPILQMARVLGCDVLIDVNQSVAHQPLDVRRLGCQYLCFSGHKLGGPTGVGVLYVKRDRLERLQPLLYGGGMVESVGMDNIELARYPMRLEAGTAPFEGMIGLAAACDFLEQVGLTNIAAHEAALTSELVSALSGMPRVEIRGPRQLSDRGAIVSFSIAGLEAHGAARILSNRANICLRSGFHCAQQAHERHDWRPTLRASFGMYNTIDEVKLLVQTLDRIILA
jgi:cysteine desulfurase / selenocysteine lyase